MFLKNRWLDVTILFIGSFVATYLLRLIIEFGDYSFTDNWTMHLAQATGLTLGFSIFSTLDRKSKKK